MSGKLDQALDEIVKTQRKARPARRGRPAKTGSTGGIQKKSQASITKKPMVIPTAPANKPAGEGKIIVSNLPQDVNETQIKEYFNKSVGPIKRVEISYGPNGVSRGIVNVTFNRPDGATKALSALNGLLVDGRAMKVEIVLDARNAPAIPAPKGLSERIVQPKSQPKSAVATKAGTAATAGAGRGRGRGRGAARGGRNPRPAKKTAEELDSEMADYFVNGSAPATAEAGATTTTAQPAASGDAMDDEEL